MAAEARLVGHTRQAPTSQTGCRRQRARQQTKRVEKLYGMQILRPIIRLSEKDQPVLTGNDQLVRTWNRNGVSEVTPRSQARVRRLLLLAHPSLRNLTSA